MHLCKRSEKNTEPTETSKPIEVIIFPVGQIEQKGTCIGFESKNCTFRMTTQELSDIVNKTNTQERIGIANSLANDMAIPSSVNPLHSTSTTTTILTENSVTNPYIPFLHTPLPVGNQGRQQGRTIGNNSQNPENQPGKSIKRPNTNPGPLTNGDLTGVNPYENGNQP